MTRIRRSRKTGTLSAKKAGAKSTTASAAKNSPLPRTVGVALAIAMCRSSMPVKQVLVKRFELLHREVDPKVCETGVGGSAHRSAKIRALQQPLEPFGETRHVVRRQ